MDRHIDRDVNIRRGLVRWFASHKRDMPWRRTRDPYAVWVSEIMLQQTRVETVTPYFTRWMARFPTVRALAEAPLDDVLSHWAGLGYYARARNLHAAARDVVGDYGGAFPSTAETLRAVRGIGPYTAGAIASIAFGEAAPIVDGNVVRVLARVDALDGAADDPRLKKRVWQRAGELVRSDGGVHAGDFNQAMMELGATVCTPTSPGCSRCPVAAHCRARADGDVDKHPAPKSKKPPRVVQAVAVMVERDGKLLLVRRPPSGLWGGLWEPPWQPARATERPAAPATDRAADHTMDRAADCATDRAFSDDDAAAVAEHCIGMKLSNIQSIETFDHVLTHRRMRFHVFAARGRGRVKLAGYDAARWQRRDAALDATDGVGVAAWTRRLLQRRIDDQA
ncbi:MAG TPA: A/G-specific adenine glycosylase [Polyangia bacterium]|nr:A/G-specific adenine glycosylase [Polyangia bacterium]